ncbi:MAG: pseudouridine synthase, partial [Porticoccaceae bacterium]|nr:pseudouridine synthase [Porticoccaceae bacterium]
LMLLTDNGSLQQQISHPKFKLRKTYWVHVEGISTYKHCEALRAGIDLKDGFARALSCRVLAEPALWKRNPPIRSRKTVADTWLEIVIDEGRNRQIRRMTAAVGLPTLRLVRRAIGSWTLGDLKPGEYRYDQTHKKSIQ